MKLRNKSIRCFMILCCFLGVVSYTSGVRVPDMEPRELLTQFRTVAEQGKVLDSDVSLCDGVGRIKQVYGEPSMRENLWTYDRLVFSLDEGHRKINTIYSYDARLKNLSLEEVRSILGAPMSEVRILDIGTDFADVLVYKAGRFYVGFAFGAADDEYSKDKPPFVLVSNSLPEPLGTE